MELATRELILCFYAALYGEIVAEGPDDARVAHFTAFYTSALDIFFSVWLRPMLLRGILTDNPVHAHPHAHEPAQPFLTWLFHSTTTVIGFLWYWYTSR